MYTVTFQLANKIQFTARNKQNYSLKIITFRFKNNSMTSHIFSIIHHYGADLMTYY